MVKLTCISADNYCYFNLSNREFGFLIIWGYHKISDIPILQYYNFLRN